MTNKNISVCTQPPSFTCPRSCPKFQQCNAPLCPLDPEWQKRKHLKDEKSCLYLLESCKADAEATFRGAGLEKLYEAISAVKPAMIASCAAINRACTRASTTPSRLECNLKGSKHEE